MEREPLIMRFCLRCGKPVYDGAVCAFCGFDLRRDENDNPPPVLSTLSNAPASLFPTLDLMTVVRVFLIIILIVGSVISGVVSYEIGEKQYFDNMGRTVYSPETDEEYATSLTFHSSEHFIFGFLAGVIMLLPLIFSIFMRIRREFLDQKKPELRHPWNIWIVVNTIIAIGILFGTAHSYWHRLWGGMGFGELLLYTILFYYASIIPTAGAIGYLIMIDEPSLVLYGAVTIIGTYSVFITGFFHYRYTRKRRQSMILEFISHSSPGREIPITEIGLVVLLKPEKVRSLLLWMKRKGTIHCSIQNWIVNILEGQGSWYVPSSHSSYSHSDAMIFKGSFDDRWWKLYAQIGDPDRTGEAEQCFECGHPLTGETHCPLCGYRSLYSYYDSMSTQVSPLIARVSSLREGINPLRNLLMVLIIVSVGFSFIVGGLSYIAAVITGRHNLSVEVEFLFGLLAGALIAPFIFIPLYLKVRREIIEQRPHPSEKSIVMIMRTNMLVTLLVLSSGLSAAFLDYGHSGPGEIFFWIMLLFYASVATGGIVTIFVIYYGFSKGDPDAFVFIILLIATYLLYAGMIYAVWKGDKGHLDFKTRGLWKRKMDTILRLLSSFAPGDVIPLHAIGRMNHMEPNRVRPLLLRMIRKGFVTGSVSEFHLKLEGIPFMD